MAIDVKQHFVCQGTFNTCSVNAIARETGGASPVGVGVIPHPSIHPIRYFS